MDQLSDIEILSTAWRALTGNTECEGWRTIPITIREICHFRAGRRFPGNQEAVLFGFREVRIPAVENLPEGNGFVVRTVDLATESENRVWFALLRQIDGNSEMFTMMASDIVATLKASKAENDDVLFKLFLRRIHAWQGFMQHGREGVLSPSAEVGLHGELTVLGALLQSRLASNIAIESWKGPLGGIHDFQLGRGAIEVKTTISSGVFFATVNSLDQLDESLVKPLFLAGVRLKLHESGFNLFEKIAWIQGLLKQDSEALNVFGTRLLHAGYFSSMSAHYPRRFLHDSTKIFLVDNSFPRLTHANVAHEISNVRYELDLNLVNAADISIDAILHSLGEI